MLIYLINKIKQLSRKQKQSLMVCADVFLLPIALWISLSLRLSNLWPIQYWIENWWVLFLIPLLSIPLFIHYGLYRAVLKYMGYQVIVATVKAVTLASLCLGTLLMFIRDIYFPRSTIMIFWFVSILVIIASRYVMKAILYLKEPIKKPIGLYGAGEAGSQVIDILRSSSEYLPVALFDDSPSKWGTVVNSMWVNSSDEMGDVIKKKKIKLILLAMLGISQKERRQILQKISKYPVEVRMIAGIDDLISGDFNLQQIKSVDVEDILGRDPVEPNRNLLEKNIKGKNVLVTGAGGSIGRELCKQIINLNPQKIVLYENNEFALYKIHLELDNLTQYVKVVPLLSSILDPLKFKESLIKYQIHTVYHAAAYKHVPMQENNPWEAVITNIQGTLNVMEACENNDVDRFVLVSTDKVVRPKSIMGMTKKLSEDYIQFLSGESKTQFIIVRFGNVLGSNGSVVILFEKQIANGGPVTVTHPEMERFFMVIPEAVQLILQAGAIGVGSDVFLLDMGKPVKITDLANKMIRLSGYEPGVDIKIKFTGIRPGEKLAEELINIGEKAIPTKHKKIQLPSQSKHRW